MVLRFVFMQQALVACALISAVAPLVGGFVVQRRQSLIGDGIGHVAFAGVGLAFLLGVDPLVGALVLTVVAAFALHHLQRVGVGGDLALALIFYGGIAVGFLFASRSGGGVNSVLAFLFGSPLNLSWAQVGAVATMAAVVALAVVVLYGPLLAMAFDEAAARVAGVPVSGLALALTVVVALLVVGGMYAIGLLLISAMMVVPVGAAARLAGSYRGTLALSSAIGALSAVAGLLVAFYADHTPGAAIVLTALGCYLVAGWLRPALRWAQRKGAR
jgi:zinc transport system permease protein